MPNITQITPPRVAFFDNRTGDISREWYRFFYNLYYATGGTSPGGAIPTDRGGTGTNVTPANGQLLIGNGTTGAYTVANLGTGPGIAKTVGAGSLSIENTGVLSVTAGQGINASPTTGDVTVAVGVQPYLDFDDNLANPAYQEGRLFYDKTQKALSYYNEVDGITVNLGQEQLVRVFNNSGATILNGQICYLSGGADDFPEVMLAQADSDATSSSTLGMATFDIADGAYGYVCTSGLVHDLDTSAYAVGDSLYLSAAIPGGVTNTLPLQPNYNIIVGYVTAADATAGTVFINIQRLPWYPNGQILLTAASYTLPTTPAVFTQPTAITQQGISYDAGTGVLTFNVSGSYTLSHTLNCEPSAANKNVYFYVEESTDGGSTWVIAQYSARELKLPNATQTQLIIVGARYYEIGTKIRYYLWGDATVYLKTADLPGTTPGTVTLPAYRLTLAG